MLCDPYLTALYLIIRVLLVNIIYAVLYWGTSAQIPNCLPTSYRGLEETLLEK